MLPYALLSLSMLALRQAPAGTQLHIRLTTPVGSYGSAVGSPVSAVLIAPMRIDDETLIPAGSELSGIVTRAQRVGFGILHETATLALGFTDVTLPDGRKLPLSARVTEVDNSRERVVQDGSIRGIRTTSSVSYRFSGYLRTMLCWEVHARIAFWVIKTMVVQVPEPEIFYPAGAELTLTLTDALVSTPVAASDQTDTRLTRDDRDDLEQLTARMPYRAATRSSNRPSDLVNLMFVGSQEQITAAFESAGWTETKPASAKSIFAGMRAVAESRGFGGAPMSALVMDNEAPDMSWQKTLNDMSKRHHIRVWKRPETWEGQQVWIGAATRDVDFAYLRPGGAFTHRIDSNIDDERDKVAHDLQFTSCTSVVDWWQRPDAVRNTRNATGDLMYTDGRLAVIRLNDCPAPRSAHVDEAPVPRIHGNIFQRFVRRQVLSVRSDFYRNNLYWRSYEGMRWMVSSIRRKRQLRDPAPAADFDRSGTEADSFFNRARNSSWFR
ncbi:MAG TPA: LssY C-terminal domain-containing protein [Bryobacteraceae bacterium]|nr:LssY C-terminal domain-containing protein [Bryobacteraceae bacterium]